MDQPRSDSDVLEETFTRALAAVSDDPVLSRCLSLPAPDSLKSSFSAFIRAFRYKEALSELDCAQFPLEVVEDILDDQSNAYLKKDMLIIVSALAEARTLLPDELGSTVITDALRACLPLIDLDERRSNAAAPMIAKWWKLQNLVEDAFDEEDNLRFATPGDYVASLKNQAGAVKI